MATCTYSFQSAQGPITIKGQAEFKAYLASQGVESILPVVLNSPARAPIFYSPLARAVQDAKMDSMPGKQWSAWLLSNAGKLGVKKDEIEWSGITDWLALQTGKVSKADVASYLDGNGVQVEEVMKGDTPDGGLSAEEEAEFDDLSMRYRADPDALTDVEYERLSALENKSEENPLGRPQTKYFEYTVPGGENYKELLLTLPTPEVKRNSAIKKALASGDAASIERLSNERGIDGGQVYKSSHWNEANILAHVRFDERTDADGKRVLFLNEIQSDWGQEGKKKGFAPKEPLTDRQLFDYKVLKGKALRNELTDAERVEYNRLGSMLGNTPAAPFVTDTKAWVSLAIKRMLRYAVDNGFDKVAFVNGQQAADLYDLSKQIDSIQYNEEDGLYNVGAYRNSDAVFEREGVSESELEDLVGKEVAQKIIAGEGKPLKVPFASGVKELSGLDLQVGGEGMRAFYDQIVPQVANDVLKKVGGGKVEQSRIATGDDDQYMASLIREKNPDYGLTIQNTITITPEMATKISSGLPLFSNRRKPGSGSMYALPEESRYDAQVRTWQNDQVRWKRQMDALRERGGVVNEQNDVYQAMERMIARAMNRTEDFYSQTVTPTLQAMKEAGVTLDDLGDYLYALHAKERNAYIAEINPAFTNTAYDEVGGSGMSDKEADDLITKYESDPKAGDYKRFAAEFRRWAEANLDGLVQGGLLSQEQAAAMRERFPNYVPLRGFETGEDETGLFGQGAGFSTGKRLFQRTLGRRSKADNPAGYIIHQVAEGMLAREKANVGRYLERLVAENPDDKLWTIGQPEREPVMGTTPLRYALMLNGKEVDTFNTRTQAQQYRQLMNLKGATIEETGGENKVVERDLGYDPDKEVRFIRDGKQVRIQLKDPLLAKAYNNRGAAEMGVLLRASATINGFLREMWTQKNPVFPLVNMIRDVPSGMLYAAGEGDGLATGLVTKLPGAWKAMWQQANGKKPEGEWGKWVDEYRKSGGGIGFRMVGDIQSTMDRINRIEKKLGRESILEALQNGKVKEAGKRLLWRTYNNAVTDFIEKVNQAFENMTRLAIYRTAREAGRSVSEASRMAKNATVNFNRRGEMTNNINSLYLFANAAIQDLTKNKRSVMDAPGKSKVAMALGGIAGMGFALAMMMPDDDELIEENQNINSIRFRAGDKSVSIPLAYGLIGFAHYLGRSAAKLIQGEDISRQTLRLASALFTNALPINPIPNPDSVDLPNTVIGLSPTAIEFPLQVAMNRNSFGSMMMPDYNNDPDAYKSFRGTRGSIYASVAEFLNETTGGTKREPGLIDVSPETLKGIVHFTLGGTGKFVGDTISSGRDVFDGGDFNANKMPVVNRFVKENDATVYRARFYRQAGEAKRKLELYNKYRKDGNTEKLKELSAWVVVGRTGNQLWKQMNNLRDEELKAKDQLTGSALDAKLRQLDEKQTEISNRFYRLYKKVEAPKSAPQS